MFQSFDFDVEDLEPFAEFNYQSTYELIPLHESLSLKNPSDLAFQLIELFLEYKRDKDIPNFYKNMVIDNRIYYYDRENFKRVYNKGKLVGLGILKNTPIYWDFNRQGII